MSTDVKTPRSEYTIALPGVIRNRAAISGGRAVKAGREMFLKPLASMCCSTVINEDGSESLRKHPQLTYEGMADYEKYLELAYFYAATQITVEGLIGLIFSKDAKSELPAQAEFIRDNIDGKGTTLREMSIAACREAISSDWSGFLVARPETPTGASEKFVEDNNLRPKILHYKFESIINWDYTVINNVEQLSLLVLKESKTKRTGFKVEVEDQYRVLELIEGVYHQAMYDTDGNIVNEASPVIINGEFSNSIPFFWVEEPCKETAPITGLVDANFEHYNIFADYGGKLHLSSFAIFTETGASPGGNMMLGNGMKWNNPNDQAQFSVLQADGNSDGFRIALQDMEVRMAALGAEQLKPRTSGAESAEAKGLDKVSQSSSTANIAITVSKALTLAINFVSKQMNGTEDTEYLLNTDYNPTGVDAQTLSAVFAVHLAGKMPTEDFFTFLQKGELINAEKTLEEYLAQIETNNTGME